MSSKKAKKKGKLHPRNKHHGRYDLADLASAHPALKPFLHVNKYDDTSIDFFDPAAVIALNTAILMRHYQMESWSVPEGYLCPPIPGRADYIHYLADLLAESNNGDIPKGQEVKILDIGLGANCIYPIIGVAEYDWSFVGSEIDTIAMQSAADIVQKNQGLRDKVELRLQSDSTQLFANIIKPDEYFHAVLCNPPFHSSREESEAANMRKLSNLKNEKITESESNFGGQSNELWYAGGEKQFISRLIKESKTFKDQVGWFTTLVSKESNLSFFQQLIKNVGVKDSKVIKMGQGNKKSRLLAWRF